MARPTFFTQRERGGCWQGPIHCAGQRQNASEMSVWHVQRGAGREGGDNCCAEEEGGEYERVPRAPCQSDREFFFHFSRAFYVLSFLSEVIATLVFLLAIILHFTWWAWWRAARASMTMIKISLLAGLLFC